MWLLIFYAFRAGDLDAAIEFCFDDIKDCGLMKKALLEYKNIRDSLRNTNPQGLLHDTPVTSVAEMIEGYARSSIHIR